MKESTMHHWSNQQKFNSMKSQAAITAFVVKWITSVSNLLENSIKPARPSFVKS